MAKKIFISIMLLMTISLIGIITVQIFWIGNAIEIREKQFSNNVKHALARTNEILYQRDFVEFTAQFMDFFETREFAKQADFEKFVYEQINTSTNETFRFSSSGVYETKKYKSLKDLYENDSLFVESVYSLNGVYKVKNTTNDLELSKVNSVEKFKFFNKLTQIEKVHLEDAYKNKNQDVISRLSKEKVRTALEKQLQNIGVEIDFKYGLFDKKELTDIKSNTFKIEEGKSFHTKLFSKYNKDSPYELYITFPKKGHYIFSDIGIMLLLSVFFTVIIILTFASSLYQMFKQKKIAAIKTDFINNMTHEFKTPIATINLALDAIKNPKIIHDDEKVLRYVSMIKEENKRMHAQVENVLRMSKLEKKEIDVDKQVLNYVTVVEEAIAHTDLLLKDKGGTLTIHENYTLNEGVGNQFHLTNAFVNIVENAIKYSSVSPKIDIFMESSVKYFTLKVKDEGIGMSKSAQKHVFDKFYREQKGNIHDVKGHGLGMAYVKAIVEVHHGKIFVESEKGKGSLFTIKLPLI